MFAAIIEWSMEQGYTEIVTGTDVRFERILKRGLADGARRGAATDRQHYGRRRCASGRPEWFERVRSANYASLPHCTKAAA